MKQTMDFH